MKIWLNGKVVDEKNAKVSIFDRGFLYGDGVFETMRSHNRMVFKLDEHLDRLYASFRVIDIKIPYSKQFLKQQIYRLLKVNKLDDAYIRVTVTRGQGTIGLAEIKCKDPTVVIIVIKFKPYPAKMYRDGITVKIVDIRQNEKSPLSGIKSISFLNNILARLASHRGARTTGARHRGEAKKGGFDDAIMLNSRKEVSEATVSNIFLIKGRVLMTPSLKSGILPGITRRAILDAAPDIGLRPKQKAITLRELYGADEIFLTNSLMGVMPVTRVDGKIIGKGRPGLFTKMAGSNYLCLI